ncbi:DUF4241 domain-containing protein [Chenggangzhangella methanolivorans]|uniref:DUF4241 domain-containing protein n=1 Tax=Chenggangzhangella methanolivorans TaxID=1437009 RepID=A0A9E6R6N7_9HYPH|nr:DUF4241 domain-containing protein [Chenggangzhangella methanolivorans]
MHRSVLSVFLAVRLWLGALALIAGTAAAVAAEGPQAANLSVVDLDAEALKERMIAPKAIGDLVAPTGRIIAADPLVNPDHPPFGRTVAPGSYPVTLFFAQERVALAMLRLAPGKIARWRIATTPGQDARSSRTARSSAMASTRASAPSWTTRRCGRCAGAAARPSATTITTACSPTSSRPTMTTTRCTCP